MIVVVLVVAAIAAVIVRHTVARSDGSPYGPADVDAAAQLQVVTPTRAQQAFDRLAGPGRMNVVRTDAFERHLANSEIIGRLTFRTPGDVPSDGEYSLFVIDRRAGTPVPQLFGVGPAGSDVSSGWDGRYNAIAARYPWLHMLASVPAADGSGSADPGMALSFPADTRGPITFNAALAASSLPVTDPAHQLTIALVLTGAGGRIYWATKLSG